MKYSELNSEDLAALRILATLEPMYPEELVGKTPPSEILAGWQAWRKKAARVPPQQRSRDQAA